MTEFVPTLKRAVAALERAEVPYLLSGSVACWARGAPVVEPDVDFVVKPEDAERALAALVGEGMRPERPPEQWLLKAWDGEILVDLIFGPSGLPVTDQVLVRGETLGVVGMRIEVMDLNDVLTTKLLALTEHGLAYDRLLQIARALREQIDWAEVRARTRRSPYARAFFTLVESLGIAPAEGIDADGVGESPDAGRPRVRIA